MTYFCLLAPLLDNIWVWSCMGYGIWTWFSVYIVLGARVGYQLLYSINMLIGLVLYNYFGTWEGYLVVISLDTLVDMVIGTGEGYLVGLSLVLPLGSPLEYLNPRAELPGMLLGSPLGLCFSSEPVRCRCCCRFLMNFREATYRGVGGVRYFLCTSHWSSCHV